jgi:hypothetical protein
VWQIEYVARRIALTDSIKVVFVPMIDSCRHLSAEWWAPFKHSRVLSFSWILHERLRRWGVNSFQAQYFPDPSNYAAVTDFTTLRGFLWQRQKEIGLPEAEQLSRGINWDQFFWHVGMDQG